MGSRSRPVASVAIQKFEKPRIFLADMDSDSVEVLRSAGFNVTVGSFGSRSLVDASGDLHNVSLDTVSLPNFEEQDIVILNTSPKPAIDRGDPPQLGVGVEGIWQAGTTGAIDPRPLAMLQMLPSCNRILKHGGIFIVVMAAEYNVNYIGGTQETYRVQPKNAIALSNWSFLEDFAQLESESRHGNEITFNAALLTRAADGARYSCTLKPGSVAQRSRWRSLASNKFNESVAGVLNQHGSKGAVLLLPQMPLLHLILVELLTTWCAQWNPQLFPYHEGLSWLHEPPYELPDITRYREDIKRTEQEAADRIVQLEKEIKLSQAKNPHWYTLLNGTGRNLVTTVMDVLQDLGFENVVDVDEAGSEAEGETQLREDIQVLDTQPALIIDVKGLTGGPTDADSNQSEKHALMRSKEFAGDVKPLTIINHQKNLPPDSRDPHVYRKEIVDNAKMTGLGLMTTLDIFWLRENMKRLSWPSSVVKPVFYRTGRIEPIPEHYTYAGKILKVWSHSFGFNPATEISTSHRLAVEIDHLFYELDATSLVVDEVSVERAPAGSNCGVAYETNDLRLKEGIRVFVVVDNLPA